MSAEPAPDCLIRARASQQECLPSDNSPASGTRSAAMVRRAVSAPDGLGLLLERGSKKALNKFDITCHLAKLKMLLPLHAAAEIPKFSEQKRPKSRLRSGSHNIAKISYLLIKS